MARLGALTCGLLALALACGDGKEVPPTQVIVTVHSNLAAGSELTSVEALVLDPSSGRMVGSQRFLFVDGSRVELPFSFGIVKREASGFRLDVVGYGPGSGGGLEVVVEQKVSASFRERETLLLKVFLDRACSGRRCTSSTTCYPEATARVQAGACGDVMQPELEAARPGTEQNAWHGDDVGRPKDAGVTAGASAAGSGGEGGRSGEPSAGDGGSVGTGGAGGVTAGAGAGGSSDAGSGGADGAAGTNDAGAGGAGAGGAGAGGSGGTAGTGSCEPTGEKVEPIEGAQSAHVAMTMASDYATQPPSSGPHCEASGAYATWPHHSALPPCNFVRNLEKGAVALLYNCPTPCPEIVAALEQVITETEDDPDCAQVEDMKRLLITPYSGMDATFAAVSWGVTWSSSCPSVTAADRAALVAFIEKYWGTRGRSHLGNDCSYGTVFPSP